MPVRTVNGPIKDVKFGVIGNHHGHIYAMMKGLLSTGRAFCVGYYVGDPQLQKQMGRAFPSIPLVSDSQVLYDDPEINLICCASQNNKRAEIAIRAMRSGKHVFVDKPGVISLGQLIEVEKAQRETGKSWFLWFCERLNDPTSFQAIEMVKSGSIGKFVNFVGLEPHKLNLPQRPDWMFSKESYGGILNDLGIHGVDMFCLLSAGKKFEVKHARVANFGNPNLRHFQDFGEVMLETSSAESAYLRADWLGAESMPSFGDIRQVITGTTGMIELRKTLDIAVDNNQFTGHQLIWANHDCEPQRISCQLRKNQIFENIIEDVRLDRNTCIPHQHSFLVTMIALTAQERASQSSVPNTLPSSS